MNYVDEIGRLVTGHDWMRVALFVLAAWTTAAAIIWVRNNAFRIVTFATAIGLGLFFAPDILLGLFSVLRAPLVDAAAAAFLGLVAVVAGILAAVGAIGALNRSALDTAANAFLDLRARYHSGAMSSAIKLLADFAIPIKEEVADLWRRKLDADNFRAIGKILVAHRDRLSPTEKEELKRAARLASGYFDDVGFLLKHKILTPEITKSFLNVAGLNIFYEVCVPLYAVDNDSAPSIEYARLLRTVRKQQGAGMVQRY